MFRMLSRILAAVNLFCSLLLPDQLEPDTRDNDDLPKVSPTIELVFRNTLRLALAYLLVFCFCLAFGPLLDLRGSPADKIRDWQYCASLFEWMWRFFGFIAVLHFVLMFIWAILGCPYLEARLLVQELSQVCILNFLLALASLFSLNIFLATVFFERLSEPHPVMVLPALGLVVSIWVLLLSITREQES